MFKPVGNLQTNNGKRIVKWAHGQMRLGRPEPLWFDCVARLHPPLSFASAPTGHRLPNQLLQPRPQKIVFPEDASRRSHLNKHPGQRDTPVHLGDASGEDQSRIVNPTPDEVRLRMESERLCKDYLKEEAAAMEQAIRIHNLKGGDRKGKPHFKKSSK